MNYDHENFENFNKSFLLRFSIEIFPCLTKY